LAIAHLLTWRRRLLSAITHSAAVVRV